MTDLEREIRRVVASYVAKQDSLADFSVALASLTWDLDGSRPEAEEFANAAALLIAETTSGHRTEDELRQELGVLLGDDLDVELATAELTVRRHRRTEARSSNASLRVAVLA